MVAAALAVQTTAQQDDQVIALLEQGDRDGAIALKEKMVASLAALLEQIRKGEESGEEKGEEGEEKGEEGKEGEEFTMSSSCATLTQVLARARQTLEQLKASSASSSAEMSMEIRYQQRTLRAMSDDGQGNWLGSGCDSDDGEYDEDEQDDGEIGNLSSLAFSGLRTQTDDSQDNQGNYSLRTVT